MPITASGTSRDKHNKSYVNSPCRGENFTAQEVFISNASADPVPVVFSTKGVINRDYNEISSTTIETLTIINKTVVASTGIDLLRVDVSGDNRAVFRVEINSSITNKIRTYFTDYNAYTEFKGQSLVAGDNIKIIVENKTNMSADFNATLIYSEYSI